MSDDPRSIVRKGYDLVSYAYREDLPAATVFEQYLDWLTPLYSLLPECAAILDLGCGCGTPTSHILTQRRHAVLGVDLSPVQIARAQQLVPEARFLCADMTDIEFAPETFDAVVCLYALIHVPLAEQPPLIQRIATWLRPGGAFLATVGCEAWTGTAKDWLDVPGGTMFWSHADSKTYVEWIARSGMTLHWQRFVPEGCGGHTLLLATV